MRCVRSAAVRRIKSHRTRQQDAKGLSLPCVSKQFTVTVGTCLRIAQSLSSGAGDSPARVQQEGMARIAPASGSSYKAAWSWASSALRDETRPMAALLEGESK